MSEGMFIISVGVLRLLGSTVYAIDKLQQLFLYNAQIVL